MASSSCLGKSWKIDLAEPQSRLNEFFCHMNCSIAKEFALSTPISEFFRFLQECSKKLNSLLLIRFIYNQNCVPKKRPVNPNLPLPMGKLSPKLLLSENRTLAFWGGEVWRVSGERGVRSRIHSTFLIHPISRFLAFCDEVIILKSFKDNYL